MKSLVFWGAGRAEIAGRRQAEGVTLLLWKEAGAEALRAAGLSFETASSHLGGEQQAWIDSAADAWVQAWPHVSLVDGQSFAERVTWKGESLGWSAEAFLRRSGRSPRCVRLIETFRLLLEAAAPDEVEAVGLARDETLVLGRVCTALKILFHGSTVAVTKPEPGRRSALRGARDLVSSLWRAIAPRGAPSSPRGGEAPATAPVLWLVEDEPVTPLPEASSEPAPPLLRAEVGRYSAWSVHREVRRACRLFREEWRRLRKSPGLHEAFSHRRVAFADLAGGDLAELMRFELPGAVRRYEEVAATLRALRPRLVFLRPEDRAAQAACRAAEASFVFFRGWKATVPPRPEQGQPPGVVGC